MPDNIRANGHLGVVIVDPDHRVRQSLSGLICCLGSIDVAGTAADAGEALAMIEEHRPNVVLVDPRLPDVDSGLGLVREIRARYPETRVVVMGWSETLENPAFASGATAFIGKGETPNAFLDLITSAANGTL